MKFSEKKLSSKKEKDIIREAKDHLGTFRSAWTENINNYKNVRRFINGDMWLEDLRNAYTRLKRPVLTFNKIRPYIQQIVGEDEGFSVDIKLRNVATDSNESKNKMQQNFQGNPQQVPVSYNSPKSDNIDEILEGLLRNIAYHSETIDIYNDSYIQELEGGYSAWRIIVSKENNLNNLRIRDIKNPTGCYWDLSSRHTTKVDGDFAGLITYISKAEYMREYATKKRPYPDKFTASKDFGVIWGDENKIAICEEYRREYYSVEEYKIGDSDWITKEEFDEYSNKIPEMENNDNFEKRSINKSRIIHYKFTDHYLLEKSETPFDDIPLLFVPGRNRIIDNKQCMYSFAEDALDAQRLLNFVGSDIAQWLKLTKKTKFIVAAKTIDRYIADWRDPDTSSVALRWDPDQGNGIPPREITPPPMPTDLMQQYVRLESDIQNSLGRYEPNIGALSKENSGIAIYNRAIQGNTSLAEYRKGRNKAIRMTGKIILNAIPHVYDTKRNITITDGEGEDKIITINDVEFNPKSGTYESQKTFKENNYSVEIGVGASFPMQKASNSKIILDLIKADPTGQVYGLLAPIMVRNLEISESERIADRLESLTPPAILAKEKGIPIPPNANEIAQQQFQKQLQQLELMLQQQKIQSEKIKNMVSVFEAKTDRLKLQSSHSLNTQKVSAEMERTEMELRKTEFEEEKQMNEHLIEHAKIQAGRNEMNKSTFSNLKNG